MNRSSARPAPRGPRPPSIASLTPTLKRLIQQLAKQAVDEELERRRNERNIPAK